MARYSVLVSVPEVIYGFGYYVVDVDADSQEQAEKLAVEILKEGGESQFVGFEGDDGASDWSDAKVELTSPWQFAPGQRVLLKQSKDTLFPDIEVEIVKPQHNFGDACPHCHIGRRYSEYPLDSEDRYLVKYPTGVTATVRASLLSARTEDEEQTEGNSMA